MKQNKTVYYQAIKDAQVYLDVYSRMRAEPTNALQMDAIFESLPALPWVSTSSLEVASGGGFFTRELMRMGVQKAACCDIEATCVEACQIINPTARVILSDVTNLAFDNDEFDLALAIDIIEHVEDHETMLDEMHRVLKSGGLVVISTQNSRSLENILGYIVSFIRGREWKGWDPTHVRFYNSDSLRRLLSAHGFEDIRFNGTLYLPFHFVGRLAGKPLDMLGFGRAARIAERVISAPVYGFNYLFEMLSKYYPFCVLGWGIIVTARKA